MNPLAHVLPWLRPPRRCPWLIQRALVTAERPMTASAIAEVTGCRGRVVRRHLTQLESGGYVTSRWGNAGHLLFEATNRRVIEHGRIADEDTRIERYERWLDTPPDERKWT